MNTKLKLSPVITIMTDESTDLTVHHKLVITARIVDPVSLSPSTHFLTDLHITSANGRGVFNAIKGHFDSRIIDIAKVTGKLVQKIIAFHFGCIIESLFRERRSTTEQIFNLRILCKKYLQHQQNLYHVFIDFKKAFDRVWHEALWATMRKYNINASIIRAIENLYDKAQSAVLFNGSTGEWFRTTVGVRQGCLLSPTLFNIFLERIIYEALDDHEGSVSIGGRLITNFRFADDIVTNAEEEEEAGVLIDRLDRTTTRYKMVGWLC